MAFDRSNLRASREVRDQCSQGLRLLIGGEVSTGQTLDLETELTQSFVREVDLPVLKGVFVAATHEERELPTIRLEQATKVEPVGLRPVIDREAGCARQVEQSIAAIQGIIELANLRVRDPIAFGPHHSCHHLEQSEGASQARLGTLWEAAQDRRSEPWVGVPVREEPAIEDENAAYIRPTRRFAPLRALKPASQMLQDDKRGEVEGDQRRGLNTEIAPDRFDEISAFGRGIGVVLGLVAVAHADILDEEFRHLVRQMWQNLRPPERAIRISGQEGHGVRKNSLPPQEYVERRAFSRCNRASFGVIADALTAREPVLGRECSADLW